MLTWEEAQLAGLTKTVKKLGDKLGLSPKQTMIASLFFAPHVSFDLYKRDMKAQDKAHAAKLAAEDLQQRMEEEQASEAERQAHAELVRVTRRTLNENARSAYAWGRYAEQRLEMDTTEYVEVVELAQEGQELEDLVTLIEYVERSNAIMEQMRADIQAAAGRR